MSTATRSSDRSGVPVTRLRGRRLILARVAWIAAVTLIVALFLARFPAHYTLLQTVCTGATCGFAQPTPDSAQALQKLGLSVGTYATFTLSLIFPLCLGLAILRYRLWDIDIIIHRTLLYSTLTFLLAAVYEVSVFTLESFTGGLTLLRGNQLAIFASTLLIGLLFKPLHDRTKALIDRRFYRRKYDAARTLAAFSATVRDEVDLNQLCTKLEAVVEETMQPTHVSLWLCLPKSYSEQTTRALPLIETGGKP